MATIKTEILENLSTPTKLELPEGVDCFTLQVIKGRFIVSLAEGGPSFPLEEDCSEEVRLPPFEENWKISLGVEYAETMVIVETEPGTVVQCEWKISLAEAWDKFGESLRKALAKAT